MFREAKGGRACYDFRTVSLEYQFVHFSIWTNGHGLDAVNLFENKIAPGTIIKAIQFVRTNEKGRELYSAGAEFEPELGEEPKAS